MSQPLFATESGRGRALRHLVRDHKAAADIETLKSLVTDDAPYLVALWWLHGHEADDTDEYSGCPVVRAEEDRLLKRIGMR